MLQLYHAFKHFINENKGHSNNLVYAETYNVHMLNLYRRMGAISLWGGGGSKYFH